jgi:hypothetical protein
MDLITGLGIGHALRDAELLSTAILQGLGGKEDVSAALAFRLDLGPGTSVLSR